MSLQVWLPLNGNLNNQGLLSTTVTSSTSAYNTSGKIGQCYNNTTSGIKVQYSQFNTGQLSLTVWVKPNSPASWADIFSIGQYCNRLEKDDGTGYYWFTNDSSKALIAHGTSIGISLTNGVWYHIAVTIDGATTKIYVNGSLSFTATQPNRLVDVVGSDSSIYCGARQLNGLGYASYLNDFRIYDHCLSPMEVKEISKGLVCHYKLSGPGGYNLLANTYTGCAGGNGTVTANGFGGFSYRYLKYEGTSYSDTVSVIGFVTPSASTKYTVSFWAKGNCSVICYFYPNTCASGVASTGATTTAADGAIVIRLTTEWERYWITWTTSSGVSGSKSTVLGRIYNQGTGAECYIAGVKFEQGDKATPWCPHTADTEYATLGYNDNKEYDCSGYGNNATKTGPINWSSDSRRYSGSYIPANTSSYLSTTLTTSGYANSYTIAYWAKISDMNNKMAFGFGDGNRLNLYPTGSVICWNTGDGANNPFKNNGTSISYTSYNGGWHHYAITGNGTTATLYVDGVKVGDATTYKAITGTTLFISGWDTSTYYKWDGGNISDFRIYATPLSAQDIKSLYQTAASVSKSGVMAAYEFVEE